MSYIKPHTFSRQNIVIALGILGLVLSSFSIQAEKIFFSIAVYDVEEGSAKILARNIVINPSNSTDLLYLSSGSNYQVGSLSLDLNGDTYAWTQAFGEQRDNQGRSKNREISPRKGEIVGDLGGRVRWITDKNQVGATGEPITLSVLDKTPITYFESINAPDSNQFVLKEYQSEQTSNLPNISITIQSSTDKKSDTLNVQMRVKTRTYEHTLLPNSSLAVGPPTFTDKESIATQEVVDGEWGCFVLMKTKPQSGTYLILLKAELHPRKNKQASPTSEQQYMFESKVMRVRGELTSPKIYERTLEIPKKYLMLEGGATIFDPALPSPRNKGVMPSFDRFTTWSAREPDRQNFYGLESIESIELLLGPRVTSIIDRPEDTFKILLGYNHKSLRKVFLESEMDVLTRLNALSPNNNNSPFESISPDTPKGVAAVVDVGYMVVPYYLSKRWLFPGRAEILKSVGLVQAVNVHSTSDQNVYALDYFFEQRVSKTDLPKRLIGIIAAENSVHYTDFNYKLHVKDGEEFAFVYSISETEHIFIFNTFNLVDPLN